MEDILAIILVLAGVALATLAVRWFMRRSAEKAALEAQERARQIEDTRKWRESMRTKMSTPPPPKSAPAVSPSYTPSYTTSRATSTPTTTSSDDGFLNGMLTGMLIDSAINSISHKSEPSVGVSKSESSWGFDDSDSRKSLSSSLDTFGSWSSSSDSSSSSSDSGPSSDW